MQCLSQSLKQRILQPLNCYSQNIAKKLQKQQLKYDKSNCHVISHTQRVFVLLGHEMTGMTIIIPVWECLRKKGFLKDFFRLCFFQDARAGGSYSMFGEFDSLGVFKLFKNFGSVDISKNHQCYEDTMRNQGQLHIWTEPQSKYPVLQQETIMQYIQI